MSIMMAMVIGLTLSVMSGANAKATPAQWNQVTITGTDMVITDVRPANTGYDINSQIRQNAENGDHQSQYILGVAYATGDGVGQNYEEAIRWLNKAADDTRQSEAKTNAQIYLGGIYQNGDSVLQDYNEAIGWYTEAAVWGSSKAQIKLGVLYTIRGDFNSLHYNPADLVLGHMWLNISGANGETLAKVKRDQVSVEMTAENLDEANRRAKNCLSSNYTNC